MTDINGFIENTGSSTSSEIRESIENKNLLLNKGDIYSSSGTISLGKEGELFNRYGYCLASEFAENEVDIKARRCVDYTLTDTPWEEKTILYSSSASSYPVDFLEEGENDIVTYQFILKKIGSHNESMYISFAPVCFIKKKAFNNFYQINFIQGTNDEEYVFSEDEQYYYYDESRETMETVSFSTQSEFDLGINYYGFLFIRKMYAVYGYGDNFDGGEEVPYKLVLDENGIYGVYNKINHTWVSASWDFIKYVRIK